MPRHAEQIRIDIADVRSASEQWWHAHESGAPAEVVQELWEQLDHLCRSMRATAPEDSATSRFGWDAA